jgi:hypothetical protein
MGRINVWRRILGWVVVTVNKTVFGPKMEQSEVDGDEVIRHSRTSLDPAICPQRKSRVPSKSKYCPDCRTEIVPQA